MEGRGGVLAHVSGASEESNLRMPVRGCLIMTATRGWARDLWRRITRLACNKIVMRGCIFGRGW